MDKRKTIETIKAEQIFAEIKDLEHPFLKTYSVFEAKAENVARHLRMLVDAEFITTTVKGQTLYVGTKRHRTPMQERMNKLEGMVRKLALHTDSENLYDEAMQLLGMEV